MFQQTFGAVTIETAELPKRGNCLRASLPDGMHILMDYCGMDPQLVPDGITSYCFGNKLILVIRKSDMTEEECRTAASAPLVLAIHLYKCIQLSLKVGDVWFPVTSMLPHCLWWTNDENAPVDEAVFLFADTHDSEYMLCRSVKLPQRVQEFLQNRLSVSRQFLSLEQGMDELTRMGNSDPERDFFDYLYDVCRNKTAGFSQQAQSVAPDAIPDGIYLEIDGQNKVVGLRQNPQRVAAPPVRPDEQTPPDYGRQQTPPDYGRQQTPPDQRGRQFPPMSDAARKDFNLAQQGDPESQFNLGFRYEEGDGVPQDFAAAAYWYDKASEQNYTTATFNLGLLYYNGKGVKKNIKQAVSLFSRAAEKGDMYAQFNMGVVYYNGDGVPRDVDRAKEWFRKSAAQGYKDAANALRSL